MPEDEKWVVNVAFTAESEATAKKIVRKLEDLEAQGKIGDMTGIEGPFDSLQLMLKRRVDNLSLDAELTAASPTLISSNTEVLQKKDSNDDSEESQDWFDDEDDEDDEDWLDEEDEDDNEAK